MEHPYPPSPHVVPPTKPEGPGAPGGRVPAPQHGLIGALGSEGHKEGLAARPEDAECSGSGPCCAWYLPHRAFFWQGGRIQAPTEPPPFRDRPPLGPSSHQEAEDKLGEAGTLCTGAAGSWNPRAHVRARLHVHVYMRGSMWDPTGLDTSWAPSTPVPRKDTRSWL